MICYVYLRLNAPERGGRDYQAAHTKTVAILTLILTQVGLKAQTEDKKGDEERGVGVVGRAKSRGGL